MSLHSRDQDLLLLAHDALPAGQKLRVQIHIVLCARCRERLSKLEDTSFQIAARLRGPALPAWTLPNPNGALVAARSAAGWIALFAGLLVLTVLLVSHLTHTHSVSQKQSLPNTDGGCRPDLPNDKCR